MPVHQRRLQLLKARRNQTRHTEFIFQLEKLMSVAEFDKMTPDEMIIHLFAETADSTMSKIALETLSSCSPSIADLREGAKIILRGGLLKSRTSPFENTYPPLKMVILVWTPLKNAILIKTP